MIGDILKKLNSGSISAEERNRLGLWADSVDVAMPFILGLQNGRSDIFASSIKTNKDTFTRIIDKYFEADTASTTVNIPASVNHLLILGGFQTDRAAYNDVIGCRLNGDSGSNYAEQYEGAQASTQVAGSTTQSYAKLCIASGDSASDHIYGGFFAYMPNIRSSYYKSVIGVSGMSEYTATEGIIHTFCTFWNNTSSIASITIMSANSANIKSGSRIGIYGIL